MTQPALHYEQALGSAMTDKRLDVLRAIHALGSISQAARAAGVSYKAAWQAVETLGNLAGVPLIEKAVGGSGGGGARLTAHGLELLRAADLLNQARQEALAQIQRAGKGLDLAGVAGVGLRTSMRNHLPCTIVQIKSSRGAVRVFMHTAAGLSIVSRITRESQQLLGLQAGMQVLALCKATAVTVAPTIVAAGEVNLLHGQVLRRASSDSGEVTLQLAGDLSLVGFAESTQELKLRRPAMAAVDEAAVVVGLAG